MMNFIDEEEAGETPKWIQLAESGYIDDNSIPLRTSEKEGNQPILCVGSTSARSKYRQ